ncbi:MAG: DNA polymerase Y family protein [Chthoniobacterales bacterium]|nr:DNA polymerase Y family protein [Chthoniobacterales bacterium]
MGANAPSLDTPLVLIGHEGRRRVVLAADQAARRAGLSVGMPATKAQALVEGLVIFDADPEADSVALHKLAVWMQRHYSPLVTVYHPDGLVLDITGVAHLFGGEDAMLKEMIRKLAAVGCGARLAAAPSYGAAHALARCVANPTLVLEDGKLATALDLLPITALRLTAELPPALKKMGFERIGELNSTPRAPLALRFGSVIGIRLDQAYGRASEPFDPIIPPEVPHVRRNFAEPIGAPETIARYVGVLVEQLCAELEVKGLGARKLDLLFYRVDNRIEAVRVGTSRPVREVRRLTKLLCDQIEKIDPGFGIETMTVTAFVAEPLVYRAAASGLGEPKVEDVSALIDTLSNRIGESQLYRLAPVESEIPERAVKRVAPLAPAGGQSWPAHWPRPSRLLDPPEHIETVALLPDHPPAAFTWRGLRRRVARADGPERIFGEWWKHEAELAAVRDYFQVEDEAGERYWLFRAGDGEDLKTGSQKWFLHGVFA